MKRAIYHLLICFFVVLFFPHKVNMGDPKTISAVVVWISSLQMCVFIHAKGVWQAESWWSFTEYIGLSI